MTEVEPPDDEPDEQRESARAFEIISERDPFRLVIRGYALIEETVDGAINSAFANGTPAELQRLNVPALTARSHAEVCLHPCRRRRR